MDKKPAFIISLLITLLIASNIFIFHYLKKGPSKKSIVTRIIDGDTIEIENGKIIRLENINTPEKDVRGYEEAKSFLYFLQNATIEMETTGLGKYGRTLGKIYTPNYLNLEIVKKGLGNKFLVDAKETKIFSEAEAKAIENQEGLWKKSKYFNCFDIKIRKREETVLIKNNCALINLDGWTLKDESRKRYNFKNVLIGEIMLHTANGNDNETDLFWNQEKGVWNDDRDSLYLFDKEFNLAYYKTYGY